MPAKISAMMFELLPATIRAIVASTIALMILTPTCVSFVHGAPLPEVTGFHFESDKETIAWNSLSGTAGYHVYSGMLTDLPSGNYGVCLKGSIQGASTDVPGDPDPGTCFFYLVTGFDDEGEGSLGLPTVGPERTASLHCIPARRFFELSSNGDAGDGVEDGTAPRRNPNAKVWSSSRERTGVYLHTGEFFLNATDLSIPGRGFNWSFTRTYRSQITFDGPLGHNWDFKDNARLAPIGVDILYHDGSGRREEFYREDATHFTSPSGFYSVLIQNPDDTFTLRYPNGTLLNFHSFDGSNRQGALESVKDSNGDRITYLYDHQGLLTTVVDTMGRAISYAYNEDGRLETITDYHGRSCIFTYDGNGDLAEARSPIVVGTPNGNDFPDGKKTSYTYSSGSGSEALDHNMLSVIAPNEYVSSTPHLQNSYGSDPSLFVFDFDRVILQMIGGTNASAVPAGGTLTYSYTHLNDYGDPSDPTIQRRQATVFDRNGNQEVHVHNCAGNLLTVTEFTNRNLRPGEPDYTTNFSYNNDGEVLEIHPPEGNSVILTYDTPGADRFREGNVLEKRYTAGTRGDGHGSSIADIVWTYTYEPVFNRLATLTEPRGNDTGYVPQNGGTQSAERYRTSWTYDYQEGDPATNGINDLASRFDIVLGSTLFNLGDINGDGSTDQAMGNPMKIDDPTVHLDAGSNQAAIQGDTTQEITTLYQYNDHGQLTVVIDPEQNRHEFGYSPESDPDGDGTVTPPPPDGRTLDDLDGGWWVESFFDVYLAPGRNNGTNPTPTNIQYNYSYDPVGNRIGETDGNGVYTRRIYNELDQVMEVRRAAATADASGPEGDPPTGRGETGLTAYSYKIRYEYDANDNVTGLDREDRNSTRGIGPYIEATHIYDILDNTVEVQKEVTASKTLATQYRYDPNENMAQLTQPVGNLHIREYDERDLLLSSTRGVSGPRGGTASTRLYDYDGNGNLAKLTDGRGNWTDYLYDGFDRLVQKIDEVGNTVDFYYDPISNIIEKKWNGPVDGSSSTHVLLSDFKYLYDEMSRNFRLDRALFLPSGTLPSGNSPIHDEGTLMPSDGHINTIYEYDRLSRHTFHVNDSQATTRYDYDGISRLLKRTDAGNNLMEYTYDDNGNVIELSETELSSTPGPPPELFLTTYFYDSLDRRVRIVDNVGQTWDAVYDSLDAVTTSTDPNGPAGGTINRRSPGHTGETVQINTYGNVTNYSYDGLDRRIESKRVLTPSGKGDGTINPTRDTSNPYNPDGEITLTYVWDNNSLLSERLDDRNNSISYSYDNLNRLVTRNADDATQQLGTYDANDNPTSITDANGSVITNIFDNANRKTLTTVSRGAGVVGTTQQSYEYDGLNRLTKATDNNDPGSATDNVTVSFIYDSLGRLIEKGQSISDGTGTKYTDIGWLAEDLQTDLIYPSGRTIEYNYDSADRAYSVIDPSGPQSATFSYFGLSRVHTRLYGNGVEMTMLNNSGDADIGFDEVKRVINLRHIDASDTLMAGFEYRYDRASNRTSVRRMHHDDGLGNYMGELYKYDSSNRLKDFKEGFLDTGLNIVGPLADAQLWTLDGTGNWPEMARNGELYLSTPNNLNEYDEAQSGGTRVDDGIPDDYLDIAVTPGPDGMNLAHDKNGNQIINGNFQIAYDFMNRPVGASRLSDGLTVSTYSYDPVGNRISSKIVNSGSLDRGEQYFYGYILTADSKQSSVGGHYAFSLGGGGQYSMAASGSGGGGRIYGGGGGSGGYVFSRGGGSGGYNMTNVEIETRNASDLVVRQTVPSPDNGQWLWQIHADSSSQYNLEDALGSTSALGGTLVPVVLERVTYDAYGKPTFEEPGNVPILNPDSTYIPASEYGNPNLFAGKRYDPELGIRADNINEDLGGYYYFSPYSFFDPNQGRFSTRGYSSLGSSLMAAGNPYNFNGDAPLNIGDEDEWEPYPSDEFTPGELYPMPTESSEPSLVMYWDTPGAKAAEDVAKKAVEAVRTMIRNMMKRMMKRLKLSAKFVSLPPKDNRSITVMFNPEKVSINKTVPWKEESKAGKGMPLKVSKSNSVHFDFSDSDSSDPDFWDIWDFDFWDFDLPDPTPKPPSNPRNYEIGGAYTPDQMLVVLGFTVEITGAGTGSDPDSAWETCTGGALNIEVADSSVGNDKSRDTAPGHKNVDPSASGDSKSGK